MSQTQVAARKSQAASVAARADYELLRLQSDICELDRMVVQETGISDICEQLDPDPLQVACQLFLLVNLVYHALGVRQEATEIDLGAVSDQTITGELLSVTHKPGGFGKSAGGHTAIVGTRAAHIAALNQRHRRPQFASSQRGGYACGPSSNDNDVEDLLTP
jgi:hypothetical protein